VSDIEQRVKQAVAEQLGIKVEEIKNEASFMDDLGADSLDLLNLLCLSKMTSTSLFLMKILTKSQLFNLLLTMLLKNLVNADFQLC